MKERKGRTTGKDELLLTTRMALFLNHLQFFLLVFGC